MVTWWNLGLRRLVFSPELAPVHRRIELLEQFDRDNRLLVLDQTLVDRQSARHAVTAGNIRQRERRAASCPMPANDRHSGAVREQPGERLREAL
jgi:hypothetical protein